MYEQAGSPANSPGLLDGPLAVAQQVALAVALVLGEPGPNLVGMVVPFGGQPPDRRRHEPEQKDGHQAGDGPQQGAAHFGGVTEGDRLAGARAGLAEHEHEGLPHPVERPVRFLALPIDVLLQGVSARTISHQLPPAVPMICSSISQIIDRISSRVRMNSGEVLNSRASAVSACLANGRS